MLLAFILLRNVRGRDHPRRSAMRPCPGGKRTGQVAGTAWKTGVVRKGDVGVAKNYLREDEIEELNRIVVMFLDFAEDQARRRKQVFLQNWMTRLHDFLKLNERSVLPDSGKVSREEADSLAEEEYERFSARRRAQLENEGQADTFKHLEAEVKKLPGANMPKRPKP